MQRIAWIAALLAMLTTAAAGAAKIYKWSDARGQIHYGELPPVGWPAQMIDIQTPPEPSQSAPGQAAAPASSTNQPIIGQGEHAQRAHSGIPDPQPSAPSCELARQNLQSLQAAPDNRRFREPSGQIVRYTEAQLQAKITATQHYLAQHCTAQ
ncbi:MAG TPA: DUF4124 domain-containing protein [Nitrococcus sp.]|nr:DUF4124 domain-containing protein [Nitrococcus sp.]